MAFDSYQMPSHGKSRSILIVGPLTDSTIHTELYDGVGGQSKVPFLGTFSFFFVWPGPIVPYISVCKTPCYDSVHVIVSCLLAKLAVNNNVVAKGNICYERHIQTRANPFM